MSKPSPKGNACLMDNHQGLSWGGGGGGGGLGGAVVTHLPPTSKVSGSNPGSYVGKVGSCLPVVDSLQYRTLTNCMYWFPLPTKLPVVIQPEQC